MNKAFANAKAFSIRASRQARLKGEAMN